MIEERKALVVGIDHYPSLGSLQAAVADAKAVARRLLNHADVEQTPNYAVQAIYGQGSPVKRADLRAAIRELLDHFEGNALFYFAGHGVLEPTGAYLVTSDGMPNDWGIPMQEVVDIGLGSRANSITVLLDCCHSGNLAAPALLQSGRGWEQPLSVLRKNMTVIAASTDTQTSMEDGGHGLFTAALLDGLDGAAADLLGAVTTSALYAHVERRFGPWQQRPVSKSYVTLPTVVRKCRAKLTLPELRRMTEIFQTAQTPFRLGPAHDPDCTTREDGTIVYKQAVDSEKFEIGQLFKKYRDAGLLRPTVPNEQLFFTAQFSHTVELTPVGQEYWHLARKQRL